MKSSLKVFALFLSFFVIGLVSCKKENNRVLYIDSYHEGLPWSDGITKGVKSVILPAGKELKIARMDTKRNGSEEFKKEAGLKMKKIIEEFDPAVVIASDDNAAKYVIVAFYKDKKLPFVFSGVNWDASVYGFPTPYITGMVEVTMVPEIVGYLKEYAKGDKEKFAYIAADDETGRKEMQYFRSKFNYKVDDYFVKTWAEYTETYKKLQKQYSFIILGNNAALKDWPETGKAKEFFLANTKVPTGAPYDWLKDYALITVAEVAEEHGEWPAQTALKIMAGASPKDIPVVTNKKGNLFVNMALAKKMNVVFSRSTLANAEKVE